MNTHNQSVIVYRSVFNREDILETDFETYLNNPSKIFEYFDLDIDDLLAKIKSTNDKRERNNIKRDFLPAMDLSQSGILAIDIDGINDNKSLFNNIVDKLSKLDSCFIAKESVSGNIVAFFKYECSVAEYKFLYYKLYLELTLLLSVNIDFLPEIGRLRYISDKGFLYENNDSEILTEIIDVDILPSIKTSLTKNEARNAKFGSR